MKRLLAGFASLAALVILAAFFLRDIGSTATPVSAPEPGIDSTLQLKLSPRLTHAPPQRGQPVADNKLNQLVFGARSRLAPLTRLDTTRSR
ncbi:MAG: hypothetical protein OES99_12735, partial [Gammaproteobacteria bacterium]|nr:hypothetical protein [Gammaproteobacteria bacterium]